jgi:hypothetical protein
MAGKESWGWWKRVRSGGARGGWGRSVLDWLARDGPAEVILDFWNMFAKHDSLLQKSPLLARPVDRRPTKQGALARLVFQKLANSRLNFLSREVPKFACRVVSIQRPGSLARRRHFRQGRWPSRHRRGLARSVGLRPTAAENSRCQRTVGASREIAAMPGAQESPPRGQ